MSARHTLDPSILGAYDIRGIVGETLSGADMAAIGRGFATIARQRTTVDRPPKICVGRDGRLSSPELEAHLVDGLTAAGADVLRIGAGPTPMLYFSVNDRRCDGGIMITGSHNPPAYNGVKMVLGGGPFYGADIEALAQSREGRHVCRGHRPDRQRMTTFATPMLRVFSPRPLNSHSPLRGMPATGPPARCSARW